MVERWTDDRRGCNQSADCPEAVKPATVRLVGIEVDGQGSGWRMEVVSTSLPIALKPKPATIRLVGVEVDGRGG
ncbi:hypothetical protein VN97_g5091, partial [Penicillium thymicola]